MVSTGDVGSKLVKLKLPGSSSLILDVAAGTLQMAEKIGTPVKMTHVEYCSSCLTGTLASRPIIHLQLEQRAAKGLPSV